MREKRRVATVWSCRSMAIVWNCDGDFKKGDPASAPVMSLVLMEGESKGDDEIGKPQTRSRLIVLIYRS